METFYVFDSHGVQSRGEATRDDFGRGAVTHRLGLIMPVPGVSPK